MKTTRTCWAMATVLLLAGCAGNAARDGSASESTTFPEISKSTMPEGDYVNRDNLRKVAPGMTKQQLYRLLGAPHFNEGVFGVRQWNYIFDFRNGREEGTAMTCQYQIDFDRQGRSTESHWKPESCKQVLTEPPPAAATSPAVPMPSEPIRLSSDALFDFDSAQLNLPGRERLSGLLQQVRSASQIQEIMVVGYTDRIGGARYNRALSNRRAGAVRDYLVAGGVASIAIRTEGRGEADPRVQCPRSSRASLVVCLSPNRRVEVSGALQP